MNERERFHGVMQRRPVDRPPLLEEGVREAVISGWHRQGLPEDRTHLDMFGLTPHENVGSDLTYNSSYFGRIIDLSARDYRKAFDIRRSRFPHDWDETVKRLEKRDHIACIWASRGFFQALGVGDWATFAQAALGTIEKQEHIQDLTRIYGDFCASMLELALQDVDPDFIYLSEPISDNDGPLISPAMFEEFMIPAYRRIVATARDNGCANILVSTYGNTARLFPAMIEAGVTMVWISEAPEIAELDYRNLRRDFGSELALIGGIPLSILRAPPNEPIRDRLAALVAPLLQSGRYIPLAAGRVREEISWAAYRRYREALAEILMPRGQAADPT
jgi:hypothetical protein